MADESEEVPVRPAKRVKRSIEDDLICPITLELPVDPVTAMDGQVYERHAIEKHIQMHEGEEESELRSPITNEEMGEELLPAPRHRNIIEVSIENGAIKGELAKNWISKRNYKKKVDNMLERAENGDGVAMCYVCKAYFFGFKDGGFMKDHEKALVWAQRAHCAGHVVGTSIMGVLLIEDDEKRDQGMLCLGMAAGKGDPFANYQIGKIYAKGLFDFPRNLELARKHLEISLQEEGDKRNKEKARKFLGLIHSRLGGPIAVTPTPSPST